VLFLLVFSKCKTDTRFHTPLFLQNLVRVTALKLHPHHIVKAAVGNAQVANRRLGLLVADTQRAAGTNRQAADAVTGVVMSFVVAVSRDVVVAVVVAIDKNRVELLGASAKVIDCFHQRHKSKRQRLRWHSVPFGVRKAGNVVAEEPNIAGLRRGLAIHHNRRLGGKKILNCGNGVINQTGALEVLYSKSVSPKLVVSVSKGKEPTVGHTERRALDVGLFFVVGSDNGVIGVLTGAADGCLNHNAAHSCSFYALPEGWAPYIGARRNFRLLSGSRRNSRLSSGHYIRTPHPRSETKNP
jgi:hypothetical protein